MSDVIGISSTAGQAFAVILSTIIVEDGSIVPNANSFVTDAEFLEYAAIRGFTLPDTIAAREALLIRAIDYFYSIEHKLSGCRLSPEQEPPYPRYGACYNGFALPSNSIPKAVKNAQMELAIAASEMDLLVNESVQNLASFDVKDVYSESYHSGGNWSQVRTGRADAYLKPLYENGGNTNIMTRV